MLSSSPSAAHDLELVTERVEHPGNGRQPCHRPASARASTTDCAPASARTATTTHQRRTTSPDAA